MAADVFTLETINATLGALEVGVLICMFLLGASTVQAYVYYSRFPRDDWRIKSLVSLIHYIISGALFP
jgi:predicted membrane-bound mannosyltransferase